MFGSFGGGSAEVTADASGRQPASSTASSSAPMAAGTDSTAARARAQESGRIVSMAPLRRRLSSRRSATAARRVALLVQRFDQWSVPVAPNKTLPLVASDLPSFLAAGEHCLGNEVSKRRANDESATRQILA